eukprot:CAMPEP_0194436750 /NCGR_PEP_ID=MMETSP0176-20130528/96389_1 /TAXON_ID=216777 /ORGANISM="Proboscia alata, Strain PI-D3" /LENGTH=47 /DNA_ID= /DNA_START= /DNA_END= /DNA_ORIENTATION=
MLFEIRHAEQGKFEEEIVDLDTIGGIKLGEEYIKEGGTVFFNDGQHS